MKLVRFSPFAPATAHTLNNIVDEFLNRNIGDIVGSDFTLSHPSVNVVESGDAFRLEIAAPGLEKGDFKINVEKNQLTVSVQKEQKTEEVKEEKYVRKEFSYHSFKRSFQLPENVSADAIQAGYENGVLTVKLPKVEVKETVKTISIQ